MPTPVVFPNEHVPRSDLGRRCGIPQNQMFDLQEALDRFRQNHPEEPIYDACQGDGGKSLPGVPPEVLDEAHRLQREQGTGYGKPHGVPMFWRAVAEDYWQMDSELGIGPSNVVACQGGRDALLKAYTAMLALGNGHAGDYVVMPRVPWVSYNWGPYLVGANVLLAPGDEDNAWSLEPDGIRVCAEFALLEGRRVAGVVITSPDNPTGRYTSLEEQIELIQASFSAGIPFVLLDWIYHYVTDLQPFSLNALLRVFTPEERKRIIVMDGITKSLGGSNIRNAHLVASEEVVGLTKRHASHGVIPSFYGQAVAVAAYRMGYAKACRTIAEPTSRSRAVLRGLLDAAGVRYIMDQGYYAFINIGAALDRLEMRDSEELGLWLAEEHGIAIVPGSFFSRFGDRWVRFSYALEPERTREVFTRLWAVIG